MKIINKRKYVFVCLLILYLKFDISIYRSSFVDWKRWGFCWILWLKRFYRGFRGWFEEIKLKYICICKLDYNKDFKMCYKL